MNYMKHPTINLLDHLPPEIVHEATRITADFNDTLARVRDHLLDPAKHKLSSDPLEQKLAKSMSKLKGRLGKSAELVSPMPRTLPSPATEPLLDVAISQLAKNRQYTNNREPSSSDVGLTFHGLA